MDESAQAKVGLKACLFPGGSRLGDAAMGQVVTIGLDLAKSVFQIHGVDAAGEVVVRRRRSGAGNCWRSSPSCQGAWWG